MTSPSHNPPLVLVADDDKVIRVCLRQAMEQDGYQVIEAVDGENCLAMFSKMHPDVVLIDAVMPHMDGFTCCQQIQKMEQHLEGNGTPLLMITGLDDEESVEQAFASGASDFVTKPIHWAILRQRVKHLLTQVKLYEQLKSANQELQRLATSDGLTKVANRRRFDEYFDKEWGRMQRDRLPLSLVLCDIDFFKVYNDTYGHQEGDECLKKVAKILERGAKRSIDLAARYGGEEFVIILPNTNLEGAVRVAKNIQDALRELDIPHSGSRIGDTLTLSMGVASTQPSDILSPDMLIAAADRALYQAKETGRNRFCTFLIP